MARARGGPPPWRNRRYVESEADESSTVERGARSALLPSVRDLSEVSFAHLPDGRISDLGRRRLRVAVLATIEERLSMREVVIS